MLRQIDILAGRRGFRCFLQGRRQFLEADNVIRHQPQNRRMHPGMRQSLDLMHVVRRHQFTRALLPEITDGVQAAQAFTREVGIHRLARRIHRECRMRLVTDARPDAYHVFAERHAGGRRVLRQRIALRVQVGGLGHFGRGIRNQFIRPLEVMILQRRLINVADKRIFVFAVGLHGIKMFGSLGKRRIQDIRPRIRGPVRIVPNAVAASSQQQGRQRQNVKAEFQHRGKVYPKVRFSVIRMGQSRRL